MATFIATDPEGYEQYVGRGSRRLAPTLVEHAGISASERVLDVGCGTGNLTIALSAVGASVTGIDLSLPMSSLHVDEQWAPISSSTSGTP